MVKTTRRTIVGGRGAGGFRHGGRARPPRTPVKIGVVYPLSGNSASAGNYSKMAIEVGADVINNGNADLAKVMPLAKGGGLPGLKGAKIQLIFADNQGTPAAGQNQTLRLITEEKVAALIGAYQSGITLDRQRHRRALRHSVPHAEVGGRQPHRARLQVVLPHHAGRHRLRPRLFGLPQGAEGGRPEGRLDRHRAREHRVRQLGGQRHRRRVRARTACTSRQKIAYSANSTDVQPQVLQLKEKNPDVADLHLLHVGRDPLRQDDEGAELEARHPDRRQCGLQRSRRSSRPWARWSRAWSTARPSPAASRAACPTIFNELYKKKTGGDDLDDVSARGLQGFLVMADAINRAGSTDPAKIQARAQGHRPQGRPDGAGL